MSVRTHPVEKLRRIWTPNKEIREFHESLEPRTELDSMVRDFLHRIIQNKGPMTLKLEERGAPIPNTGTLRFEIIHHEPAPGVITGREVSIWIEE